MHGHFLSFIKFLNIPTKPLRRRTVTFLTFTLAIYGKVRNREKENKKRDKKNIKI